MNYSFFITQQHEDATGRTAGLRHAADPLCVPGAHRQDRPRRDLRRRSTGDGNIQTWNDDRRQTRQQRRRGRRRLSFRPATARGRRSTISAPTSPTAAWTRSGFLTFCGKLGVADSFIKSASYLLHKRRLQRSARLSPRSQRHDPAGRQRHPARLFRAEEVAAAAVRPLRAAAFDLPPRLPAAHGGTFRKATPIEFGLGYRWRKNELNLLLAQKLQTGTSESGLSPH